VIRRPDAIVEGRPELELREQELEEIAELLAEVLVAQVERETEGAA
jgi:hypothetical protein